MAVWGRLSSLLAAIATAGIIALLAGILLSEWKDASSVEMEKRAALAELVKRGLVVEREEEGLKVPIVRELSESDREAFQKTYVERLGIPVDPEALRHSQDWLDLADLALESANEDAWDSYSWLVGFGLILVLGLLMVRWRRTLLLLAIFTLVMIYATNNSEWRDREMKSASDYSLQLLQEGDIEQYFNEESLESLPEVDLEAGVSTPAPESLAVEPVSYQPHRIALWTAAAILLVFLTGPARFLSLLAVFWKLLRMMIFGLVPALGHLQPGPFRQRQGIAGLIGVLAVSLLMLVFLMPQGRDVLWDDETLGMAGSNVLLAILGILASAWLIVRTFQLPSPARFSPLTVLGLLVFPVGWLLATLPVMTGFGSQSALSGHSWIVASSHTILALLWMFAWLRPRLRRSAAHEAD